VRTAELREEGWVRSLVRFYLAGMRSEILTAIQYRVGNYFYMLGMIAEPVIYLVVWSSIARAQHGSVGGFTPGAFAAYYIVWTLVRNWNISFDPFAWEWRIKQGELSGWLVQPVHPIHRDLAWGAGLKFVWFLMWLPIAAVLSLAFHPELHPSGLEIGVFVVAIWAGFVLRTLILWLLGLITFWTTRVAAIFQLYFGAELLLSGRLVPLQLMPSWARTLAAFFPMKWTFWFPIESLVGDMRAGRLALGLGAQALWIVGLGAAVALMWRRAARRYTAVGN
jgi:ABC-2 type transport system permease protein